MTLPTAQRLIAVSLIYCCYILQIGQALPDTAQSILDGVESSVPGS